MLLPATHSPGETAVTSTEAEGNSSPNGGESGAELTFDSRAAVGASVGARTQDVVTNVPMAAGATTTVHQTAAASTAEQSAGENALHGLRPRNTSVRYRF